VDELNLEYRCDLGFKNFFRMTNTDFGTLLTWISASVSKKDALFRPAIPASVSEVEVPLLTDSFSFFKISCKITKQIPNFFSRFHFIKRNTLFKQSKGRSRCISIKFRVLSSLHCLTIFKKKSKRQKKNEPRKSFGFNYNLTAECRRLPLM